MQTTGTKNASTHITIAQAHKELSTLTKVNTTFTLRVATSYRIQVENVPI